jgi:hypothetical protein
MIVVLIVMSGMDPRMIRVTWIGMVGMLGWLVSCSFWLNYHNALCGRFDVTFQGEELVAWNES